MTTPATERKPPDLCICCQVDRGEVSVPGGFVYRSERWTVNHRLGGDERHVGWFVAQPRRHVIHIDQLDHVERREFGVLSGHLSTAIRHEAPAQRVFVAALGSTADTHFHVHFIAQATVRGLDGLESTGVVGDVHDLSRRVEQSLSAELNSTAGRSEVGVAEVARRCTVFVRKRSPYKLFRSLLRRADVTDERARWLAAELYTAAWMLTLMGTLVAAARSGSIAIGVVAGLLALLRVVDLLATQVGILFFESRSSGFAGVQSVSRSVILGLTNLAEAAIASATWTVLLSSVSNDAYGGAVRDPLRSLSDALAPLGGEALPLASSAAVALGLVRVGLLFFLSVVILGTILGNISARLDPET